jgi:hypothetical protein
MFDRLKLCVTVVMCVGLGAVLTYNSLAKGRITFKDLYPGLGAIVAGLLIAGLLWLSWPSKNKE